MKPARFLVYALGALILAKALQILAASARYFPPRVVERVTVLMMPREYRSRWIRAAEMRNGNEDPDD